MTTGFVLTARAFWLLGIAMVLAGLLTVLLVAARLVVPEVIAPMLSALPQVSSPWLLSLEPRVDPGLLLAGLGVAAMACGAVTVRRQSALLDAARRHREDALRRVPLYRDTGRMEPFIGSETGERRGEDAPRRRVA